MKTVSPGIFEVTIGEKTREIKISLGLKGEIYKLLVRKQLSYQQLATKNLIAESDKQKISALADELSVLSVTNDAERLERTRKALDEAYATAFYNLEKRQAEFMQELALEKVALTEDSVAETLAMLLSTYEKGRVTTSVTAAEILWDEEYFEAQDELMAFLDAVIEYLDASLKKTPQFDRMLSSLVNAVPR